ncbi:MAG: hypothetical protein AB8B99_02200 [Phormidesmis sp.]
MSTPRKNTRQMSSDAKGAIKKGGTSKNKNKKRLNLELTADNYELLQKLANESGKNMAEVLRTGLALYGLAQAEEKKGRNIAVVKDDKVVKQIVTL